MTKRLLSTLVLLSAGLANADVAVESDAMVLISALSNMGAVTRNPGSERAKISVSDLQCRSTGETVHCEFYDRLGKQRIELTESMEQDTAFDLSSALFRITGNEDNVVSSVECEWNDGSSGAGNYTCKLERPVNLP